MASTDFTIADVLEWARTKPADESYRFGSNTNCALCQFLRDTGRATHPTVGGYDWDDWTRGPYAGRQIIADRAFPADLRFPLQAGTFGGLVDRLERLCPETPITKSDWARLDAYMADIELASA